MAGAGAWLALALVVVQTLALLHGVLHLPGRATTAQAAGVADWVVQHEDGSPVCRLIDQLAQAHAPAPAASLCEPPERVAVENAAVATPTQRRASAVYQARGPPTPA